MKTFSKFLLILIAIMIVALVVTNAQPTLNLTQDTPKGIYELKLQGTTPPIDSCKCKPGDPGKTPIVTTTYSVVPYNNPPKAINQPNANGVNIHFELPSAPPPPSCPTCPPSGGGTGVLRGVYFLTDYANGDDGNVDTQGVQNFFNAVVQNKGYGMIPPPGNAYLIDNTANIQPQPGVGQVWAEFHAWGRGATGNIFTYVGASNKAVFSGKGWKNVTVTGFYIAISSGREGVTAWDLDGDNNGPSIGFVTFNNNYINLGNGKFNVGTRLGHLIGTFPNSNGDISNIQWNNCTTFGGGNATTSIQGQIAYLHEGRNTLSLSWSGGFGAFLESVYSNKSGPGAQFDRGNGSVFFYGYGTSQNECNYVIAFEQDYLFSGGRHESSRKFMKVIGGGNAAITVQACHIGGFKTPDGSIFDLQVASTLTITGCNISRDVGMFDKMVNLTSSSNFGSVSVKNCAISANTSDDLVRKTTGTGSWRIYVEGVNRLSGGGNGVFTNGFLADKVQQL